VPYEENRLPTDASGRIVIDGRKGLRDVLARAPGTRGHDTFAFFRGGPHGDVVGTAVADLPSGAPAEGNATLDPGALVVRGGTAPIPIIVRADVDAPADTVVALIVNGTVVGTYRPTGDHKARFVVPEAVLRPGRNDLALATVTGPAGQETLHPLPTG
jgi:hypothetical protein